MSIKCKLGFHDWSKDCEKCSNCNKNRIIQHDWTKDCEKCSNCDKTRESQHEIVGCKCSKCGKELHSIGDLKCSKCGKDLNEGNFIDERDGHVYKWIKIGSQVIMAENLAYKPIRGNYFAYDNNQSNIMKYGYLYDWETAKKAVEGIKDWHLPTKEEWEELFKFLGGDKKKVYNSIKEGGNTGFNCLLSGGRDQDGTFNRIGKSTYITSATAYNESLIWAFNCSSSFKAASLLRLSSGGCFSIRLFHDNSFS